MLFAKVLFHSGLATLVKSVKAGGVGGATQAVRLVCQQHIPVSF